MVSFISTEMVVTITMIIFFLAHAISPPSSLSSDEGETLRRTGWWNSTSPHCTWPDIGCNKAGSITDIFIFDSDKELGELSKLRFCSVPNLIHLYLYNCGLNGSIPHQIGTLTHLTYLSFDFNNLTGQLPLSLANLTRLEYLILSYN